MAVPRATGRFFEGESHRDATYIALHILNCRESPGALIEGPISPQVGLRPAFRKHAPTVPPEMLAFSRSDPARWTKRVDFGWR